ncbi:tRNA pseudouridine(13) synthase TruD, partial [Candidatus Falkowbacteria bacterium]|nr:tRNA pseudouridine(13) synthase TruD [Candidatus Falkowbacteria bacterium]
NWQPTDSTLSSSDFAGNRHMVAVRTESEVDLTAFSIKIDMITKYGFLNYFSPTHWGDRLLFARFGRLAIEGKYAAAIEMFLFEGSMSGGKLASSIRLEAEKSRGDQAKSLALWSVLPQTFANELKVVKYLEANPGDFLGALQQIKDQVARWIFAYGASLFNEALSHLASNKGVINEKLPWPFSPEASALPIYQELMLRDRTDKYLASPFMVDSPLLKGQEMPGRIFPTQLTFKPFNRGIVIDCLMGGTQTIQPLLMNIFNLNNALPAPSWADSGVVDIKKILNQGDNSDLLSSFLA